MSERDGDGSSSHGQIVSLAAVVRRVIAARVADADLVDDLTQETLTRLMEAQPRLDDGPLAGYAIVTARNVVASHIRAQHRGRRHLHRLIDLTSPESPEEQALQREDREALTLALARLPVEEREAVVDRDVMEVDTKNLARKLGSTPGGVAARLTRARAKLRVEYLISRRGTEPPTARCRPVLTALSAGDQRRQRALAAGDHLLDCRYCASLTDTLLARRRPIPALLPAGAIPQGLKKLQGALRARPVQVAAGAATIAVAVVLLARDPPARCPSPTSGARPAVVVEENGQTLSALTRSQLARHTGERVLACNVAVQSVPANEGFWAAPGGRQRIWVQIVLEGESRVRMRRGQDVSLEGTLVHHGPGFARQVGVSASEGAAELREDGHHLEVLQTDVRLR